MWWFQYVFSWNKTSWNLSNFMSSTFKCVTKCTTNTYWKLYSPETKMLVGRWISLLKMVPFRGEHVDFWEGTLFQYIQICELRMWWLSGLDPGPFWGMDRRFPAIKKGRGFREKTKFAGEVYDPSYIHSYKMLFSAICRGYSLGPHLSRVEYAHFVQYCQICRSISLESISSEYFMKQYLNTHKKLTRTQKFLNRWSRKFLFQVPCFFFPIQLLW